VKTPLPRARDLPVGTTIRTGPTTLAPDGPTVLTRHDKPGRCPWRLGTLQSGRWVAHWNVQELINAGTAEIAKPALVGVKRR
jgi:hypothetical protein